MKLMSEYPDKYFDLAIVDPPYGIGEHGQRKNRDERWNNPKPIKYKRVEWDKNPPDEKYFTELFRVSKNQIIWGANHFISRMPYNSSCWIVWDKKTAGDFADCELAWTSFDTAVRKFDWLWSGFRKQQPEPRIHPTQKPIALYKWILKTYAKPGNKILDTHLGSGSIAIACHDFGFDLVASEIDTDHYNEMNLRVSNHTSQILMF